MTILLAFLVMGLFVTLFVLLIMLIIRAVRKKPVKKTAFGMLGCYGGILLSSALTGDGVGPAFAFLTLGFMVSLPVLIFILIIKAIQKKPLKKTTLGLLGCFIGMILSTVVAFAIDPQLTCEHEFNVIKIVDATCSAEGKSIQACLKCNKELEDTLPMLEHSWAEATCETPRTCRLCGITTGEKGGHKWSNATCTTPKTCSLCAVTVGDALSANKSHSWKDATCAEPKTCSICNAVDGSPIDHTPSKWEIIDEGTSTEQGTRQQTCLACGIILKSEKFDSPSKTVTDIIENSVSKYSADADIEVFLGDNPNSVIVTATVLCENSEETVKNILSTVSEALQKTEVTTECIFTFGDIAKGKDGECLAMASIDAKGNYNLTSTSINFKTERNMWITSQFSAWDGSHTVLKNLIKDNLNDEQSFKHIETTYIDVSTKDKKTQVNNTLKKAGYSQRVDVGDLFIMTTFSAKNAFNATIKNTAFGIVDYSTDIVTLIGVE